MHASALRPCQTRPVVRRRPLGRHLVYAAAVGARPGYMSFKDSGGSVQFASGSSSKPAPSSDDSAVGPAVGGRPGRLAFTRNIGVALLSSGAVNFTGTGRELVVTREGLSKLGQSDSESLQQKIQSFGVAGVAAYGLFNTLYYTGAFLFCWLYVAKVPQGLGMATAARKFVEILALVWAGSQVTKVPRALGALAFAPLVDRGLAGIKNGLRLKSKQQAFWALVAGCLVLAAVLFGVVVLAWA